MHLVNNAIPSPVPISQEQDTAKQRMCELKLQEQTEVKRGYEGILESWEALKTPGLGRRCSPSE